MQKVLLILIAFCLTIVNNAQDKLKNYVSQNAVSVFTIEPDFTNYADLEFIGKAIGDSKIVMLGEQDHGDAPTFLAKTRLVKYLHEKKGFNVLAFESDFFSLNFGFDKLEKNDSDIDNFLSKNIFPIWTFCNTCKNLFYDYIPHTYQTSNPLIVSGFDNQLVLNFSHKHLNFYLDSLLQALNIPITKELNYRSEVLPLIDSLKYFYFKDTANYHKCESYLNTIKREVSDKLSDQDFWMQVINSMLAETKEYKLYKNDNIIAGNIRDFQMASNLKWLKEIKFPNEKIVVWAANAHVAKYIDSTGRGGRKMITMGYYFTSDRKYADKTYIIGFTSYEGEAGRLGLKTYPVRKPKPNGFENWINKSYNYSFVKFKSYNVQYPEESQEFYLKGLGHNSAFQKDWTKVFDGMFFIRNMYPCKR